MAVYIFILVYRLSPLIKGMIPFLISWMYNCQQLPEVLFAKKEFKNEKEKILQQKLRKCKTAAFRLKTSVEGTKIQKRQNNNESNDSPCTSQRKLE